MPDAFLLAITLPFVLAITFAVLPITAVGGFISLRCFFESVKHTAGAILSEFGLVLKTWIGSKVVLPMV